MVQSVNQVLQRNSRNILKLLRKSYGRHMAKIQEKGTIIVLEKGLYICLSKPKLLSTFQIHCLFLGGTKHHVQI